MMRRESVVLAQEKKFYTVNRVYLLERLCGLLKVFEAQYRTQQGMLFRQADILVSQFYSIQDCLSSDFRSVLLHARLMFFELITTGQQQPSTNLTAEAVLIPEMASR